LIIKSNLKKRAEITIPQIAPSNMYVTPIFKRPLIPFKLPFLKITLSIIGDKIAPNIIKIKKFGTKLNANNPIKD
jgi:hypothetical protein